MKKKSCLIFVLCMILALAGCGSAGEAEGNYLYNSGVSKSVSSDSANRYAEYDAEELWTSGQSEYAEEAYESGTVGNELDQSSASRRKRIRNVNMNVETQEFDLLMDQLDARIKELGGYIQKSESFFGSKYSYHSRRYATVTIRIPQARLDEFLGSVSDLANVVNRSESVDDVTLQYVDIQSHKEALMVEQARLLELLERAEYLEDIITLENRLTSVRYQIESMESTLRTFDDQVDYSTVLLRVEEVQVYTQVEEEEETVWERMAHGFLDSAQSVWEGIVEFCVWFVAHLPYLVIWALVIAVVIWIVKAHRRRRRAKAPEADPAKKGRIRRGRKAVDRTEPSSEERDKEVSVPEKESVETKGDKAEEKKE